MTPQQISSKLSKGDQVRFKDNTLLWFDKPFNSTQGFFKNENGGLYRKNYNNIMKIQGKPIQEIKVNKPNKFIKGDKYDVKVNGTQYYSFIFDKITDDGKWLRFINPENEGGYLIQNLPPNTIPKPSKNNIQEMDLKSILREEIDNAIENQKQETLEFEKDPMEYILQKYPSLEATLIDLMSSVYKDYLTGIYVVSPKPTTFKILLHNGRSFLLIYNPKSYMAKVSGKLYHLMNLKDEEYAIKAISNLLLQGIPPGSAGPGEETTNETDLKDEFVQDMTSEPDLTGIDTSSVPNEEPTEEETPEEEELQENEEPQKRPLKFRIIK